MPDEKDRLSHILADVPELPADLYGTIRRQTIRRRNSRRLLWAVAASLVLVAGGIGVNHRTVSISTLSAADAAIAEEALQNISDLFSDDKITEELSAYAFLE